ncbi:MAG: DUF1800 family protein [Pseudomonadota bacterium]
MRTRKNFEHAAFAVLIGASLAACSAGGGDDEGDLPAVPPIGGNPPTSPPPPPPPPPPPEKPTPEEASRFLLSASFGPDAASVDELVDLGYSDWIEAQFQLPVRSIVDASLPNLRPNEDFSPEWRVIISEFYENLILGEDQLRMRATYALSQFFVVSSRSGAVGRDGEGFASYVDILQEGAFGNFRDLLEEITYSPTMGKYLTYVGNRKANPATGSAPDENYAREILQLFTIGLYELNLDGTLKLDGNGQPIETYTNEDITELAKVFTGLWYEGLPFARQSGQRTDENRMSRMVMFEDQHSDASKTFLGETLSATLTGDETIRAALDVLFEHPNTAPFFSQQMIQRLTTSNPSPDYVRRVAEAFNSGAYTLPDGDAVGSGTRGDLRAVWAAILMDEEYHDPASMTDPTFGKVREPVILFTHWARMSEVPAVDLMDGTTIVDGFVLHQERSDRLGQRPLTSPSVFNFYRPGYVAAGSQTAAAGLVAPELQITTTTSVVSYANYMRSLVFRNPGAGGANGTFSLVGDYSDEIAIADDADALIDRLDLLLLAGTMTTDTRQRLETVIESVDIDIANVDVRNDRLRARVQLAIQLLMVSPEYTVQQ